MDIAAIREALADVVRTVTDSGDHPANVYAYPPNAPLTPAVLILPAPFENGQYVNYWGSYGNSICAIGLRLEIRISANDEDAARVLDVYLSTLMPQIIDAINVDPTLAGIAENVFLRESSVPGEFAPSAESTRTWLSSSVAIEVLQRRNAA